MSSAKQLQIAKVCQICQHPCQPSQCLQFEASLQDWQQGICGMMHGRCSLSKVMNFRIHASVSARVKDVAAVCRKDGQVIEDAPSMQTAGAFYSCRH